MPAVARTALQMRFMVIVKADKNSEAGALPDEKLLTEMGKFNEELAKAGILLAGEGLHPSSKGARVRFSGDKRTVVDGPFSETKELIAGYWLWQVKSKEEAIEWVRRCPNPMKGDSEIEIRQVFEAEDFGKEFTPALRAQEERFRIGAQTSSDVLYEWDIASGAALIVEAGGVITDIKGRAIRLNQRNVKLEGLIADNRVLHGELMKIAPHPKRKSA
jgi:hypothetical protein